MTTWGNTSTLPNDDDSSGADRDITLAADGPVIHDESQLDPAGAVTARTTVAGPSEVGEGIPGLEEDARLSRKRAQEEEDKVRHLILHPAADIFA